ncbi:MAG TPA: hypothetical protein VIM77_04185, partial [Mucilaginibacter sp.]
MDQHLNNTQSEILWELLADPAHNGQRYNYDLQQLVNEFPQSGILRALLAHAGNGSDLKHAAVYFSPVLLHKLINDPDSLPRVSAGQIADYKNDAPAAAYAYNENYFNIGAAPIAAEDTAVEDAPENSFGAAVPEH